MVTMDKRAGRLRSEGILVRVIVRNQVNESNLVSLCPIQSFQRIENDTLRTLKRHK